MGIKFLVAVKNGCFFSLFYDFHDYEKIISSFVQTLGEN